MTAGALGPRRRQRPTSEDEDEVRDVGVGGDSGKSASWRGGGRAARSVSGSGLGALRPLRARPVSAWLAPAGPARSADLLVPGTAGTSGSKAPARFRSSSERDSILGGMGLALKTAQVLAVLPVSKPTDPERVSFVWSSFRVAYCVFIIVSTFFEAALSFNSLIVRGFTFYTTVNVVFFTTAMTSTALFLRLCTKWYLLTASFSHLETQVMRHYGYPHRLGQKMSALTLFVFTLAAVEHSLSIASTVAYVWSCYENGGFSSVMKGYFTTKYTSTFTLTSYALWKGLLVMVLHIVAVFIWNFVDLFVMLVSVGITSRFRQFNQVLLAAKGQMQPPDFWRRMRETYNVLAGVTKTVDQLLGPIILLSYATNLYFICLQLLLSMTPIHSTKWHDAFFFFSLIYITLRTILTSALASNIYEESRKPKDVLYTVPSASYCLEVQRFLAQVTTDHIAFSGCNFFSVTRGFMLTVAGTILTYVVILVQLDGNKDEPETALSNRTISC